MLKINEEESLILNRIFEEYSSGKTILQICRDFEKENITNKGNKFIPQAIRHFLKRELYTGTYKLNGKTYDKIYPQIISTELFNKVNTKLNANRYGCRKDNHEIFKLKDKIYCGSCDRKMYPVSAISSNGSPLRYYKCITTKKKNCEVVKIDKHFIENIVNRFIQEQFCILKNLEIITNNLFEVYQKNISNNLSLNSLKSDLAKVNTSISNIIIAIEKGILTDTTKQRLEELEKQKQDLQEKLLIEESKQQFTLTQEEIQSYFKSALKQDYTKAIELFICYVKVYENKIEIGICNIVNQKQNKEQIFKKVFTETLTTERAYKGGTTKINSKTYDVYLVI